LIKKSIEPYDVGMGHSLFSSIRPAVFEVVFLYFQVYLKSRNSSLAIVFWVIPEKVN
jgi:hypothetical protein